MCRVDGDLRFLPRLLSFLVFLLRKISKEGERHLSPRGTFHHFREKPGFMTTPMKKSKAGERHVSPRVLFRHSQGKPGFMTTPIIS